MSEKFDIATKAIDLMEYTMVTTSNRKRFPIKYIMLVQRIQNRCMDIYESIINANELDIKKYKEDRLVLQGKTISLCNQLSCYIEIAMNLKLISPKTVNVWQEKISSVKYMTLAWRNREKVR